MDCARSIVNLTWARMDGLSKLTGKKVCAKRSRAGSSIKKCDGRCVLVSMADEEVESIFSFLDLRTFARSLSPLCRFSYRLVSSDSFQGWLVEIQRLHRVSPWLAKTSMETIIESDQNLRALQYRTALRTLDREFIVTGSRLLPKGSRPLVVTTIPTFFDCREDTLVYSCMACDSFVAPVDFTVGRGVMGPQQPALILEPNPTMPFCCGIHEPREMPLSSGTYILVDLSCPNGSCNAVFGWKYQECVPDCDTVRIQNLGKIGQYWMIAEALKVTNPHGNFASCTGLQFFFASNI